MWYLHIYHINRCGMFSINSMNSNDSPWKPPSESLRPPTPSSSVYQGWPWLKWLKGELESQLTSVRWDQLRCWWWLVIHMIWNKRAWSQSSWPYWWLLLCSAKTSCSGGCWNVLCTTISKTCCAGVMTWDHWVHFGGLTEVFIGSMKP